MCNLLGKWSLYNKFSVEQGLFTRGSIILKLGTNFIRYRFSSQMLDYDHVGFQFPSSIIPPKIFRLPPPPPPRHILYPYLIPAQDLRVLVMLMFLRYMRVELISTIS